MPRPGPQGPTHPPMQRPDCSGKAKKQGHQKGVLQRNPQWDVCVDRGSPYGIRLHDSGDHKFKICMASGWQGVSLLGGPLSSFSQGKPLTDQMRPTHTMEDPPLHPTSADVTVNPI